MNSNLLFVVDSWFPGVGGAELQAMKLARVLRDQGASIRFIAPHLEKELPSYLWEDGFEIRKVTYPSIKLVGPVVCYSKFAWMLWRQRHSYDCIHFHVTGSMAVVGGMMRGLIGKPMISKVSGFFEFEHGVLRRRSRPSLRLAISRWALRRIDYFQTISLQTRERLLEAGFSPEAIKYIPNGIELSKEARVPYPDDCFRIGYCGRLRAIKGVDILIHGFKQLLDAQPQLDARLVIAGDGVTEDEMHQLVKDLGIEEKVDFLGEIRDVEGFLRELDVYVQPSYAEGLPNSVIEAMNASLPVIATDIGGNRDLVEPGVNGYLFQPGDAAGLAVLLANGYENQTEMVEMGQASRRKISAFGFDRVTAQLRELYGNEEQQDD